MIKTDYHLHTDFSIDAQMSVEVLIEEALRKGLVEIAITDHVDHNPNDEGTGFYKPQRACSITRGYAEKYAGSISVHYGLELSEPHLYIEENKGIYALDPEVVIGSIHYVGDLGVHLNLFDELSLDEAIDSYFDAVVEMVSEDDVDIDILGHLDYFVRYTSERALPIYDPRRFKGKIDRILSTIISREIALEVNTSGWRSKAYMLFPHPLILEWYKEMGGFLLSIGSDAHKKEDIAFGFDKTEEVLYKIGFREYHIYRERRPEAITLG